MTTEQLIRIMLTVSMMTEEEARQIIDTPIESAGVDSLDLELLRAAIEKHLEESIPDEVWLRSRSLRELLEAL